MVAARHRVCTLCMCVCVSACVCHKNPTVKCVILLRLWITRKMYTYIVIKACMRSAREKRMANKFSSDKPMNGNYLKTIIIKCSVRGQINIDTTKKKKKQKEKVWIHSYEQDITFQFESGLKQKWEFKLLVGAMRKFLTQFHSFFYTCAPRSRNILVKCRKMNEQRQMESSTLERHTIDASKALIKSIWIYCVMKLEINNRAKTIRPHDGKWNPVGSTESLSYNQYTAGRYTMFTFVWWTVNNVK